MSGMNTSISSPKARDNGFSVFAGERQPNGSRNPIEVEGHWDWRNPLNVLPIGIILMIAAAVLALLL